MNKAKHFTGKRILFIVLLCLIAFVMIHSVVIVTDGFIDELNPVDVAVVLGNKVEKNGEPSARLKARLDKTVDFYNKEYYSNIIVSGGIGEEGFDEAKVMKDYLIENGIPHETIIEDNNGYNTYRTASNARRIADKYRFDSVMVITQYFHITRTELAFKQQGFESISSAHAEIVELRDVYSILREVPAFYKYLFTY
ncbi:vancomycin permeability regulator SanA [Salirhabdus euzebyi]|uniref:Vancomycin permeability regulator SanA n=1 Tax=Salirhabdus euzebyi TaxID=394506 RepID=A0A841PVA2_9BACI|nr:YdcF family protein [Salirhabdus euzebyi]MBB6452740.1 vancomycin permeability regulator SanA [Salirhabdus euzebyi]